jgi:hypothetical protein
MQQMQLRDLVPDPGHLMGVKPLHGELSSHLIKFGRGSSDPASDSYYWKARRGAAFSLVRPFLITIGSGRGMARAGRVLNLARISTRYGASRHLASHPIDPGRLQRWPVAVVAHEVWEFEGFPHLEADLGISRSILSNAMDNIVRPEEKVGALWEALADWPMSWPDLPPPLPFDAAREPSLVKAPHPAPTPSLLSAREGQRLYAHQIKLERDRRLGRAAKLRQADANGGRGHCEACDFSHVDLGLFDAHHRSPLAAGVRVTTIKDFHILCPTCHRKAHRTDNRLVPLGLADLRHWVTSGRP